jgi:hypothetical protein
VQRRLSMLGSLLFPLILVSCFVERPVADKSTERSLSAKIFAVDCRAWVVEARKVEAEAALVDFAEGGGDLEFRWTIDGAALPPTRDMRPRVTNGHFLKYSVTRSISHEFQEPGPHEISVVVVNEQRTAQCNMSLSLAPGK